MKTAESPLEQLFDKIPVDLSFEDFFDEVSGTENDDNADID